MTECPCVSIKIEMCSCDVELVVAEQEAEYDHKSFNSEANLTLLVAFH